MIRSTLNDKAVRSERSALDLFLEQLIKATPLYVFASGLKAALKNRR